MNLDDSPVFLASVRDVVLSIHGALAVLLLAVTSAHALEATRLARGRFLRVGLERRLAKAVSLVYPATFIVGALAYPAYRVHVRAAWLEAQSLGIAELFDVKECYAALALVLALGLGPVSARLREGDARALFRVHAGASLVVCLVVWFDAIAGLIVWSTRVRS